MGRAEGEAGACRQRESARSGALAPTQICSRAHVHRDATQITDQAELDPALAIKCTIYRGMPSGRPGDAGIFGSQQYGPLLDLEVSKGSGSGPETGGPQWGGFRSFTRTHPNDEVAPIVLKNP